MEQLLSPIMPGGPAYTRYLSLELPSTNLGEQLFAVAGRVYLAPIGVHWPIVVDAICYRTGTSAGNIRVGIYRQGTTPDSPAGATLVVESGSVAMGAAYTLQIVPIADTLLAPPGQYFVGVQGSNIAGGIWRMHEGATLIAWYYDRGGGYGAFTNPCPALTAGVDIPLFALRVKTNLGL